MDADPESWGRQRRTRRILVTVTMVAALALVPGALLCTERRSRRGNSPAVGTATSAASSGTSSGPRYPDPFLRMTPAGIAALDEKGLCKALCRTHMECFAFRRPDSAGDQLNGMLAMCNVTCDVGALTVDAPDPVGERMARECLMKFNCTLFEECVFGLPKPPGPAVPSASGAPPAGTSRPR